MQQSGKNPEQVSEQQLEYKSTHPEYLHGVKGWLLAFIATTAMLSVNFLVASYRYVSDPYIHMFHAHTEFEVIRFSLMIAGVFFPAYIAFQLYHIKPYSLTLARVFLVLFPLTSFPWIVFLSPRAPFDIELAVTVSFVGATLLYSLPWFLYLHKSLRVMNTYLSTFPQYMKRIQCPFCLSIIQLNEQERRSRQVTCPDCSNEISSSTIPKPKRGVL